MGQFGAGFISAAALAAIIVINLGATPAASGQDRAGERLPGSREGLRDSVRRCQLIVIANGVEMGLTKPDFPDRSYYSNVRLKVQRSLTGEAAKELGTSMMIRTAPPESAEAIPRSDRDYLFILEAPGQRTIKVLRATEENIQATAEALGAVEDRLPGSTTTLPEAVLKSRLIVVAKVIALGMPQPGSSGRAHYSNVELKAMKFLKGEAAADLQVFIRLTSWPLDFAEATPKIGREYLFFLEAPSPSQLRTVKVLLADEENVRATTEAMESEKP